MSSRRDICDLYTICLDSAIEKLRSLNPRRVLLHAPNGLKPLYNCVENSLSKLGLEVYYSSEPAYGSCDIPIEEAIENGVDVVLHIGHEEYVLIERIENKRIITLYVPVYYNARLSESLLGTLHRKLLELGAMRVTVSSTIIETPQKVEVANYLREKGLEVYVSSSPILGCYYGPVLVFNSDVDAHVVVSGGVFHPLGLGLLTHKPIVVVDPYSQRVWSAREEADKVLRKRFYVILKARELLGGRLGLIIGGRPGQYRYVLVDYLRRLAETRGFKVFLITSSYTTLERLIAIDNALGLDIYVVTSCPRLPIDDLSEFYKPVLTPGEFLVLINESEKYIYPW